jgi:hypothetical protein
LIDLLALAAAGRDNISRQLGVLRRSSHYKKGFDLLMRKALLSVDGIYFFLIN